MFLTTLVRAQDTSIVYPTTAAASATVLTGGHGYAYIGCWNETTGIPGAGGARALSGGSEVRLLSEYSVGHGMHLTGVSLPTIR